MNVELGSAGSSGSVEAEDENVGADVDVDGLQARSVFLAELLFESIYEHRDIGTKMRQK